MRKLLSVVVFATLAWVFVVPSCGTKFGCDAASARAHADAASCPTDIGQAATDAAWAAARLDTIKDKHVTTGLFYDEDGHQHDFVSGRDDDADRTVDIGRDAGIFPDRGRLYVVDHVEVKVAAAMRHGKVESGVLVINNPEGVCDPTDRGEPEPLSCLAIVPRLLPEGATLVVWWQEEEQDQPEKITLRGERQ